MPSPFPGMDPYLEDPGLWPDVHARLISITSDFLGQTIRPKYYVRIEQRVYISNETDVGRTVMVPDVRIGSRPGQEGSPFVPGGGTAVEVAESVEAITLMEEEIRESYIEIIDRLDRTVVTVIEVLSPTDKVPGSRGRESYDRKRLEVMNSPTSLVEIDLLRTGLSIPVYSKFPRHEYLVHVSRTGGERSVGRLWPIRLSQKLPAISVPLKPEDGFARLDLQAVLNAAYDRAGYDLELDYRADPIPPLEGEWNAWAHRVLQKKGLRPE